VIKPIEPREFKQTLKSAIKYYLMQRDREDLIQQLEQRNHELEVALDELKQKETHLLRLSLLDELTNIPNRRNFNRIIVQEWQRARRNRTSLSLIMIDIDEFTSFNNSYGHQAGDECLRQVAKSMQTVLKRPGDMVARYGGEEFVVVLPETNEKGALKLAEEIRQKVQALCIDHFTSKVTSVVTISAGLATMMPEVNSDLTYRHLIELADKALYKAKNAGKNAVSQANVNEVSYLLAVN
jgi:diguanylate cyclase (GGDEF)-like protein